MTIKHLFFISALALSLAACGDKKPKQETPMTAEGALEMLGENAKNVEIKDKKGGTKNQRLANDLLQGMDKMATALENVKDQKSAEKAAKIIAQVTADFEKLEKENDLNENAMAMAAMGRMREFMAVQQRMATQMMRISAADPEMRDLLAKELDKVNLGN